ncbi:MAG: phosphatidylethanolamine N-methyltransferase family protein [Gammaproteobacteria bacterium]|nr:phosphatidylethanolamine N-methyltransferase family protein [Gammaproteobacteria bacterium]
MYFQNKPHSSLLFTRKFMYRYSRYPMMLGFLIGMWAVPVMSATYFALALLSTLQLTYFSKSGI